MSSSNRGGMFANNFGVVLDSVTFDADSGTCRADYDSETTTPSMAVIALLTEILETSPLEMDQLQYSVDTDALDALFATNEAGAEISFGFGAYEITVSSDELVIETASGTETAADR